MIRDGGIHFKIDYVKSRMILLAQTPAASSI